MYRKETYFRLGIAVILICIFGVMLIRWCFFRHRTHTSFSVKKGEPKVQLIYVPKLKPGYKGQSSEIRELKLLNSIKPAAKYISADGKESTFAIRYTFGGTTENTLESKIGFILSRCENDPDIPGNLSMDCQVSYNGDCVRIKGLSWNQKDNMVVWRGADYTVILTTYEEIEK